MNVQSFGRINDLKAFCSKLIGLCSQTPLTTEKDVCDVKSGETSVKTPAVTTAMACVEVLLQADKRGLDIHSVISRNLNCMAAALFRPRKRVQ